MAEYGMPCCDEPFDFRRQAATYAHFRPDYSAALYDAIFARSGPGAGRIALDLGCGPGVVATALHRRGWRVVGVDFSAPMLAEAQHSGAGFGWARGCAEALPLRAGTAALMTCGTAFHWFGPVPTLTEIARVLAPGGWAAIFWQYSAPDDPSMALLGEVLADLGIAVPEVMLAPPAPSPPFAGAHWSAEPPLQIAAEHTFTTDAFVGWIATFEWVRRSAGSRHGELLDALRRAASARCPPGVRHRARQDLFLARR